MAGIVFSPSSSESLQRFNDLVEALLDVNDLITEKMFIKLEEKACEFKVARIDYNAIILKKMHKLKVQGVALVITASGDSAIKCQACTNLTNEVNWLCTVCGSTMMKNVAKCLQDEHSIREVIEKEVNRYNAHQHNLVIASEQKGTNLVQMPVDSLAEKLAKRNASGCKYSKQEIENSTTLQWMIENEAKFDKNLKEQVRTPSHASHSMHGCDLIGRGLQLFSKEEIENSPTLQWMKNRR